MHKENSANTTVPHDFNLGGIRRKRNLKTICSISDFTRSKRARRAQQLELHLHAEKNALVERKRRKVMAEVKSSPTWSRTKKKKIGSSEGLSPCRLPCGPSRARLGISRLSIPLAWNSDEHFNARGDGRMYSMFVVLQTKTEIIDSRIITTIDRSCTDVNFPNSFIFENQPVDFEIELSIYSAKTSGNDGNQSLKQKLARSLSRKLGASCKSNLNIDDLYFESSMTCSDTFGGSSFRLLGRTTFRLGDAEPKTGIYDLCISPNAESFGPPLYGHICCRVVAQPNSVVMPISDGILTVRSLEEDRIYQNVRCRLQAGVLRCSILSGSSEQVLLRVCLTKNSKIQSCSHPKGLVLQTSSSKDGKGYLITAETEEDISVWKHAFDLQITDCERWGEFAVLSLKLTSEPKKAELSTAGRASGRRLYDEIQINGTVSNYSAAALTSGYSLCSPHRNLPEPSSIVSFASPSKGNQTAPAGRRKNRTPLQNLFRDMTSDEPRFVTSLAIGNPLQSPVKSESFKENDLKGFQEVDPEKSRRRGFQHSDSNASQESGRFKGLKKSWQRSFGALLNRKQCEISHF